MPAIRVQAPFRGANSGAAHAYRESGERFGGRGGDAADRAHRAGIDARRGGVARPAGASGFGADFSGWFAVAAWNRGPAPSRLAAGSRARGAVGGGPGGDPTHLMRGGGA